MNLFMACLGGRITGCNIEMHDIRFVAGEKIEDCYAQLKSQWVGDKNKVHLDGYCIVTHVDGYQITLQTEKPNQADNLYFINLGAYDKRLLMEQHSFQLVVAKTPQEAKQIALSHAPEHLHALHQDNLFDVDDCFELDLLGKYYIALTFTNEFPHLQPIQQGYYKL